MTHIQDIRHIAGDDTCIKIYNGIIPFLVSHILRIRKILCQLNLIPVVCFVKIRYGLDKAGGRAQAHHTQNLPLIRPLGQNRHFIR